MEFNIVRELNGKFDPIVLIKTDEKPEGDVISPKPGMNGCIMPFVAQTIAKRKTSLFDRDNVTCGGVATGLGWGNGFRTQEDMEFQATFLSLGQDSARDMETFMKRLEYMPKNTAEMFKHGERIYCDFDTAMEHISKRPIYDDKQYVVFKGIENLNDGEIPDSVIFTLNPIELSALLQLNYSFRRDTAYIMTPQAASCQAVGSFTFQQAESDDPVPVLSPLDFAARGHMKHFLPDEYMNLSMPWKLFLKLDELSKNSVFQTCLWENWKDR